LVRGKNMQLIEDLELLAKIRSEKTTEILAKALEIGIAKMKREAIIGQYLKGEIEREEAIKMVGFDLVILAERQKEAVLEDIEWGLHG